MFENYQILLIKISHRFLALTKLLSGWKSLIAHKEAKISTNHGSLSSATVVAYIFYDLN